MHSHRKSQKKTLKSTTNLRSGRERLLRLRLLCIPCRMYCRNLRGTLLRPFHMHLTGSKLHTRIAAIYSNQLLLQKYRSIKIIKEKRQVNRSKLKDEKKGGGRRRKSFSCISKWHSKTFTATATVMQWCHSCNLISQYCKRVLPSCLTISSVKFPLSPLLLYWVPLWNKCLKTPTISTSLRGILD